MANTHNSHEKIDMDKRSVEKTIAADFSAEEQPFHGELLSSDLLKQFSRTLAQNRQVQNGRGPNILLPRLTSNEKVLRDYNERTLEVEKKRRVTPAAEWLLDNFHLIEEQIHTSQRHLPRGFQPATPAIAQRFAEKFSRASMKLRWN